MKDIDLFMPCKGYRMQIGWVSGNDNGVHVIAHPMWMDIHLQIFSPRNNYISSEAFVTVPIKAVFYQIWWSNNVNCDSF